MLLELEKLKIQKIHQINKGIYYEEEKWTQWMEISDYSHFVAYVIKLNELGYSFQPFKTDLETLYKWSICFDNNFLLMLTNENNVLPLIVHRKLIIEREEIDEYEILEIDVNFDKQMQEQVETFEKGVKLDINLNNKYSFLRYLVDAMYKIDDWIFIALSGDLGRVNQEQTFIEYEKEKLRILVLNKELKSNRKNYERVFYNIYTQWFKFLSDIYELNLHSIKSIVINLSWFFLNKYWKTYIYKNDLFHRKDQIKFQKAIRKFNTLDFLEQIRIINLIYTSLFCINKNKWTLEELFTKKGGNIEKLEEDMEEQLGIEKIIPKHRQAKNNLQIKLIDNMKNINK